MSARFEYMCLRYLPVLDLVLNTYETRTHLR
eukprot:COSAG01_NODE_1720_length_9391_cov_27.761085_11_plen_31_part_00